MGTVRTETSLHPKTVQKIATNAVLISKTKRKPAARKRNGKVKRKHYLDGVDPLIVTWIRQNKIYYKRVEIINATQVIIHNPGEKWD